MFVCMCAYTYTFPSNIIFIYAKLNFPNKNLSELSFIYSSWLSIYNYKTVVYIFPPKASAFTILSKVQISLNWKYLYMESWSGTQWDMSTSNQWSSETCPVEHDNTHDGTYLIMFVWCLHADVRMKLKCWWS